MNMKLVSDLEEFQFRLSCGVDMVGTTHEAMENGTLEPESHMGALFGCYDYLRKLNSELETAIEGMKA